MWYRNIHLMWYRASDHIIVVECVIFYSKYPKIWNNKVSDKMAYAKSADQDQTAPEGVVWSGSTLYSIPLF